MNSWPTTADGMKPRLAHPKPKPEIGSVRSEKQEIFHKEVRHARRGRSRPNESAFPMEPSLHAAQSISWETSCQAHRSGGSGEPVLQTSPAGTDVSLQPAQLTLGRKLDQVRGRIGVSRCFVLVTLAIVIAILCAVSLHSSPFTYFHPVILKTRNEWINARLHDCTSININRTFISSLSATTRIRPHGLPSSMIAEWETLGQTRTRLHYEVADLNQDLTSVLCAGRPPIELTPMLRALKHQIDAAKHQITGQILNATSMKGGYQKQLEENERQLEKSFQPSSWQRTLAYFSPSPLDVSWVFPAEINQTAHEQRRREWQVGSEWCQHMIELVDGDIAAYHRALTQMKDTHTNLCLL